MSSFRRARTSCEMYKGRERVSRSSGQYDMAVRKRERDSP